MSLIPQEQPQGPVPVFVLAKAKALKCPGCSNVYRVSLADEGKGINFLNMISWFCPGCRKQNLTPYVSEFEQ